MTSSATKSNRSHGPSFFDFRASTGRRCPICRGDHSCSATADGLHFCWRTHVSVPGWRYFRDDVQGFGLFRAEGDQRRAGGAAPVARAAPAPKAEEPRPDWAGLHERLGGLMQGDQVERLAAKLGVSTASLRAIGCVWASRSQESLYRQAGVASPERWASCWAFPEKDGDGAIVGINRRYEDGSKRAAKGSQRGLTYADDWADGEGPVMVVEGASDTAALHGAGLRAVGRPNNLGGSGDLAKLFRSLPEGTEVWVVGERDQKDSGLWPGRDGAVKVSAQLAASCAHLQVYWCLPPVGSKDARGWLAGRVGEEAGQAWLSAVRTEGLTWAPGPRLNYSTTVSSIRLTPTRPTVTSLLPRKATAAPPSDRCPRCQTEVLAHTRRRGNYRVARLACNCWRCDTCRQRLAATHVEHLADRAQEALDAGREVYAICVDGARRLGARAALRRADDQADYAELQQADGSYLLLFAVAPGAELGGALAGARKAGPAEIAAALADWSAQMKAQGPPVPISRSARMRPVNTSRPWALPKPLRTGNWRVVSGALAAKEDTVREELAKQGVTRVWECTWPDSLPLAARPPYAWAIDFTVPAHLDARSVIDAVSITEEDYRRDPGWSPFV